MGTPAHASETFSKCFGPMRQSQNPGNEIKHKSIDSLLTKKPRLSLTGALCAALCVDVVNDHSGHDRVGAARKRERTRLVRDDPHLDGSADCS